MIEPGQHFVLLPHQGDIEYTEVEAVIPPVDGWVLVRTSGHDPRLAMMVEAHRLEAA